MRRWAMNPEEERGDVVSPGDLLVLGMDMEIYVYDEKNFKHASTIQVPEDSVIQYIGPYGTMGIEKFGKPGRHKMFRIAVLHFDDEGSITGRILATTSRKWIQEIIDNSEII